MILSSCGTVDKLLPSFAYDKNNQNNSSSDTLSQSIGYADVSVGAGDNKSTSYNKSNIKNKDFNQDKDNKLGNSIYQVGGTVDDYSKKILYDQTRSNTKDKKYNANHISINDYSVIEDIIKFIQSNVTGILFVLFFYLGWKMHFIKERHKMKKNEKI